MPNTSRFAWEYPTEGQKDWFNIFESLMNQMDVAVYASAENSDLILRGGGNISLNTSTNALSWDEDFEILSVLTGGVITIAAGSLPSFLDGKIAYLNIARPVSGSRTGTLLLTDVLGVDSGKLFFAMRRGNTMYFRNHADRTAMSLFAKTDANAIVTASASAGGGTVSGSIPVGINSGAAWYFKAVAASNTVDSTFQFFSDAGMTQEVYSAVNKDAYTSPYEDKTTWYIGSVTGGLLYYKVTNDGANPSIYTLDIAGFGQLEG